MGSGVGKPPRGNPCDTKGFWGTDPTPHPWQEHHQTISHHWICQAALPPRWHCGEEAQSCDRLSALYTAPGSPGRPRRPMLRPTGSTMGNQAALSRYQQGRGIDPTHRELVGERPANWVREVPTSTCEHCGAVIRGNKWTLKQHQIKKRNSMIQSQKFFYKQ